MGEDVVRTACALRPYDGLQHVQPAESLVLEDGGPVQHLGAPDVERLHASKPIGRWLTGDVIGDRMLDLVASFETGLGRQTGDRRQVERFCELVERRHGDGEPAVASRIDAIGRGQIGVRVAERRARRECGRRR